MPGDERASGEGLFREYNARLCVLSTDSMLSGRKKHFYRAEINADAAALVAILNLLNRRNEHEGCEGRDTRRQAAGEEYTACV